MCLTLLYLLHFLSLDFLEFNPKKVNAVAQADIPLAAQFRTLRQKEQCVQVLIFTNIGHLGYTICNFSHFQPKS